MKTKYSRLGNSAVSIVLAVLMVISSTIVGSSSSIDSIAADTPDTVSQAVAESKTAVSELDKTADDENKEAVDNTPSITKNTKGALDIQPSGTSTAVQIIGTGIGLTKADAEAATTDTTITFSEEDDDYLIYQDLYIKWNAHAAVLLPFFIVLMIPYPAADSKIKILINPTKIQLYGGR